MLAPLAISEVLGSHWSACVQCEALAQALIEALMVMQLGRHHMRPAKRHLNKLSGH